MYGIQKVFAFTTIAVFVLGIPCIAGDDEFFDKTDLSKKTSFEKKLYYGLERTDGLTPLQKEQINKALKEFQAQKEKQLGKNVKKFQADDVEPAFLKQIAANSCETSMNARTVLLLAIHKNMSVKQREQFIKKFQGTME